MHATNFKKIYIYINNYFNLIILTIHKNVSMTKTFFSPLTKVFKNENYK